MSQQVNFGSVGQQVNFGSVVVVYHSDYTVFYSQDWVMGLLGNFVANM